MFTQEYFYLRGILSDINEQDTSSLYCKHKHMMKSGVPPDKVRDAHGGPLPCDGWGRGPALSPPRHTRGAWPPASQAEAIPKGYHSLVPDLI